MRSFIALILCFWISPNVHACRAQSMEDTLFFETTPSPQPDADLIAKVSLSEVNGGTAAATLIQILKTSDARVHQGEKLPMKFNFTSCGPNDANGSEGVIIAKIGADSAGRLVLYPYMRKYGDGRITSPSAPTPR